MLNDDLITHLFNWFGFWVSNRSQTVVQSNHHTCIGCLWHTKVDARGESLAH